MRVGVDLIEIERIEQALDRYAGFRTRCFTDAEREYCESKANPVQSYAARFAGPSAGSSGDPELVHNRFRLCPWVPAFAGTNG